MAGCGRTFSPGFERTRGPPRRFDSREFEVRLRVPGGGLALHFLGGRYGRRPPVSFTAWTKELELRLPADKVSRYWLGIGWRWPVPRSSGAPLKQANYL